MERERKHVSWMMVHSGSIPEHDNTSSNLTWYHYHGIKVLGLNCSLGFESWRQVNICNALHIMKGYVLWYSKNNK